MKDIEAIFFDMGGTIRTRPQGHDHREAMMSRLVNLLGADSPPDEFYANELWFTLSRRAKDYKRWSVATLRELTEEEIWTQWMLPDWPADAIEPIAVQLNQLWRSAQGVRVVRPDARGVILELNRRGYLLGLVSNTTSRLDSPRLLRALGVSDCFKTMVLSATFGWRKPDPSIFLEATRNQGVRPDRSAYVGDRPSRDVVGPRQAGFARVIIIQAPDDTPYEPLDTASIPDHVIQSLSELLTIFPPLHPVARQPGKPQEA